MYQEESFLRCHRALSLLSKKVENIDLLFLVQPIFQNIF